MKSTPFKHVRQGPFGELAVYLAGSDFDRDFEVTVDGMEMGWRVVAVVHRDHDSKEAAYLGHAGSVVREESLLPPNPP